MHAGDTSSPPHARAVARWAWLLGVCAAFAVITALRYNIAVHSWDAGTVHVYQGMAYSLAVDDGAAYPRWTQFLHIGLGSPVFTFRPPLAYAGMDLLYRLGLSHPIGWRLLMAAGLALACTGAYLLAFEITGKEWAGILGAVAFLYAPYMLRNAFERGTPEAFGTFLYSWVLWSLIWLAKRPSGGRFMGTALFWALCISTHVLAPLMLVPTASLVAILVGWHYRTATPLLALFVGGLLTAFIWMPMLVEQKWVHIERDFPVGVADPLTNPISLDELLAPPAIYDTMRDNNHTAQQLGLWHFAWMILVPFTMGVAAYRKRYDLTFATALAALTAFFLFWMLTSASDPLWRLLQPVLERLQYRSRLMGVQALSISVIAACTLTLVPDTWQRCLAVALSGILIISALPSLYIDLQHRYASFGDTLSLPEVRSAEIASGGTAFTSFGEFTPRWRTSPFDTTVMETFGSVLDPSTQPLISPHPGVEIVTAEVRTGAWDLTTNTTESVTVTFPLLYYPRWHGFVDDQAAPLSVQGGTGYVQLSLPAGAHTIALRYGSTLVERFAIILSILTLLGIIAGGILWQIRIGARQERSLLWHHHSLKTNATTSLMPPLWLLIALTTLLGLKVAFVDPSTNWLRCTSTANYVCGARTTVDGPFVAGPRLRGFTVSGNRFEPGDEVRVKLYWQGESTKPARLSSFVHIRNSKPGGPLNPRTENEMWAQDEHERPGDLLTTEYQPGRLYADEFRLRLPSDIPPAIYFLEIGWANAATGEQLEVPVDAIKEPLRVLWRSILLPSIEVR